MLSTMIGHCLCRAVTIRANDVVELNACHCGMCRRWSGGPFMGVHGGAGVEIAGLDKVSRYRSSEWAERAFCSVCGTHLFYRYLPTNNHELSVGLFQDGPAFRFVEQIFVDHKPGHYEFANTTAMLTEAEVFAKFGAE